VVIYRNEVTKLIISVSGSECVYCLSKIQPFHHGFRLDIVFTPRNKWFDQWRIQGAIMRLPPPPGLVWPYFLDNFRTVFVSFVSRLNRKIRVPLLLWWLSCYICLLKSASKCTQIYHLGDKNDFYLGRWPSLLLHTPPLGSPLTATEILNTPLDLIANWLNSNIQTLEDGAVFVLYAFARRQHGCSVRLNTRFMVIWILVTFGLKFNDNIRYAVSPRFLKFRGKAVTVLM